MSRLAKEGWVQREREGRRTFYRLSPKGTNAFEPATRRIYAPVSEQGVDRWVMGLVPPRQRLEADIRAAGGFVLAGGCLWPEAAAPGPDWFAARGVLTVAGALGAMPEQMAAELAPGEGRAAYLRLIAGFKGLPVAQLAPLDAMVARILLIHRWRRIVLRNPDLPKAISQRIGPVMPAGPLSLVYMRNWRPHPTDGSTRRWRAASLPCRHRMRPIGRGSLNPRDRRRSR